MIALPSNSEIIQLCENILSCGFSHITLDLVLIFKFLYRTITTRKILELSKVLRLVKEKIVYSLLINDGKNTVMKG